MKNKKRLFSFWKKKINLLSWKKKPSKILILKKNNKNHWFPNGKLNLSFECIDANIKKGLGDKKAIIFIGNDEKLITLTYNDLLGCVERFCHILKTNYKINQKKRVLIHASASFESAISMLSCARLGSCHSVVFQDLQEDAMSTRVKLFKPDLIITRDDDDNIKNKFLTKKIKNKDQKKILIFRNFPSKMSLNFCDSKKILKDKNLKKLKISKAYKSMNKLFVLFTSGSTGEPKGILHSTGGYLTYAKYSCLNFFGMTQKSIVLAASDAGWINGHTYALYGPLSIGATSIILESPMLILDKEILKNLIYEKKITILYLPVTLIRILKSINKNKKFNNHNIKTLGSMGEPLAPDVGKWFSKIFNHNKAIVNTYFQTETGGVITAPRYRNYPKDNPHGSVGNPNAIFGLKLLKNKKQTKGDIILQNPWPGCMIDIINGNTIWKKYWTKEGSFNMFDIGSFDKTNSLNIHGRNDDVINIRGHRIGSEEIESIVLKINGVIECACVAIPEKIEGYNLILFVVCKNNHNFNKLQNIINKKILNNFGSFAIPKKIYLIKNLPKTKSGKILRRLLRDIVINPKLKNYGELSTILDINVIKNIKKSISGVSKKF